MGERLGIGIQAARILAGKFEVLGCHSVVSGKSIVMGDLTCQRTYIAMSSRAVGEGFGYAPVQQSPPRQAGFFINKGTQFIVAEVVGQVVLACAALNFFDQSLPDKVF